VRATRTFVPTDDERNDDPDDMGSSAGSLEAALDVTKEENEECN
jgi:hypothetical protein